MTFDAKDSYVLLFGGSGLSGSGFMADTWKYSAGTWTQLHPTNSPAGRQGAAITFDAADKYVLLFGGRNASTVFFDTWEFAAGQWTLLHPTTTPGPAAWASMAYDANASMTILFGGRNATSARGGTWEYNAGAWTRLTPTAAPSARYSAAVAYDARDGWIVLFGGTAAGTTGLGDTWTFTGGTWHSLGPIVAPAARAFSAAAYDPTDQVVLLFGGLDFSTHHYFSDTWVFAGGGWTKLGPPTTPSGRYEDALASSPANGSVTLFGGTTSTNGGYGNDTWTYKSSQWTHQLTLHPSPRYGTTMAWDEADRYIVLFGGQGPFAVYGDTWKFVDGTWSLLHPSASPSARVGASMTYDEADGYLLLFGGLVISGPLHVYTAVNDTWSFLNGQWTLQSSAAGGPAPEAWVGLTYDAADGYVVMFGGDNNTLYLSDATWTYLNGAWTPVLLSTLNPPALSVGATAYDSADGYVVLFGFNGADGAMETWTFLAGNWNNVTMNQPTSPSKRDHMSMVYDSYEGYLLLYGGYSLKTVAVPLNDTWSFVYGVWTQLNPVSDPGPRAATAMTYGPVRNVVLLFGGENASSGTPLGSGVWTY